MYIFNREYNALNGYNYILNQYICIMINYFFPMKDW